MKKVNQLFFLVVIISAAAFLAACGGSEPPAPPKPDPVSFNFVATDAFAWTPDSISVQTGQEVTIVVDNQGALEHNWILANKNVDVATASDADALYGANVGYVQGGESGELTFVAPGAGEYLYICTVAGHAAGGMVGTLIVE